jgi:hypothetical protein
MITNPPIRSSRRDIIGWCILRNEKKSATEISFFGRLGMHVSRVRRIIEEESSVRLAKRPFGLLQSTDGRIRLSNLVELGGIRAALATSGRCRFHPRDSSLWLEARVCREGVSAYCIELNRIDSLLRRVATHVV